MTELQNIIEELHQEESDAMDMGEGEEEEKTGGNGGSGDNSDVTSNQALIERL